MKNALKAITCLILSAIIVMSAVACGDKDADSNSGTSADIDSKESAVIDSVVPDDENTETEIETEPDDDTAPDDTPKISRGTWDGNVYTNDYAGIIFTLPDGWEVSNTPPTRSIFGKFEDEYASFPEFMDECIAINDIYVAEPNTMANISIAYKNLKYINKEKPMTGQEYLEFEKDNMSKYLVNNRSDAEDSLYGFEDKVSFSDYSEVAIGAHKYTCMYSTIEYVDDLAGETYFSTVYRLHLARPVDNYFIAITVMTRFPDEVSDWLNYFNQPLSL